MKKVIALFLFLTILYSCQKSTDYNTGIPANGKADSNFVSLAEAIQIAEMQAPRVTGGTKAQLSGHRVKNTFPVKSGNANPSMYIVNYETNGFAIISADNRLSPVLAYSVDNSFPIDQNLYPGGLADWLSAVDSTVMIIRKENLKQENARKQQWDKFKLKNILATRNYKSAEGALDVNICSQPGEIQIYYTFKDQLIHTTWGQGNGYNELLAYAGCPNVPFQSNGRVLTGCVATATAQIMKYWQYPLSYNWSAMANDWGTMETSRLMKDLGKSTNLNMIYSCAESTTTLSRVPTTLTNFGYPTSTYRDYNYSIVRNQLQQNIPSILSGSNKSTGKGHAWVCDGFEEWIYYTCQPDPNTPGEWIENYSGYDANLHMNWGSSGNYDGWFGAYNFNPGNYNFNYLTQMIINIKKP